MGMEYLGHNGSTLFNTLRNCHIVFKVAVQFYAPTNNI